MLSGNCTEASSIQANVTISGSSTKLIKNNIAPLPLPLPALLKQYWHIKRGERVRVRGHAPFYATLGFVVLFSAPIQVLVKLVMILSTGFLLVFHRQGWVIRKLTNGVPMDRFVSLIDAG